MNIVVWILQGLLAVVFVMAGSMKLTQSKDGLRKRAASAWPGLIPFLLTTSS